LKIYNLIAGFIGEVTTFSSVKEDDSRSIKAKKNVVFLFVIKGISILIMLAMVPLLINQLNTEKYGVWVTFATFMTWFTFFDIGLGNGLKNILANKLAVNDLLGAKKAISTAYVCISLLSILLITIFLTANNHINWTTLLNAPADMKEELYTLSFFIVISFCLQLVFRLIASIYDAIQMPAVTGAIVASGNLLSLISILLIIFITDSHLLTLYGIALSVSPIISLLFATYYFFKRKHQDLIPALGSFDSSMLKDLFGLGTKFFLIQITSIVLYQTNSFIIAHVVGVDSVTIFDTAYKYSGLFQMAFTIVLSPLWVASTDAFAQNNIEWIYKAIAKLNKVLALIAILSVIQLLISKQIYWLWIGNKLKIDYTLTALLLFYFVISMRGGIYCMVLNGIGKIQMQFFLNLSEALIHIPLAIVLGKYFGIIGVVISMCFVVSINAIWMPWQCKSILSGKAKGIWNK
jgi:O-antigen/teichoic acid export membrane protein